METSEAEEHTVTSYETTVYGKFWGGRKGLYTYITRYAPSNLDEARKLAVDFENVAGVSVVEVRRTKAFKLIMKG